MAEAGPAADTRMVSYAQNREDVLLARVFAGQARGTWIDVGAWDPILDSVTKHFSLLGWSGINIEPQPEWLDRLARDRPRDVNLGVALGARPGQATFVARVGSGLSSLADVPTPAGQGPGDRLLEVRVETLAEVCSRHVTGPIDFLKVDVTGGERAVLEGGDWSRYRPRVVVVDARPITAEPAWEAWEPLLLETGYLFAYFDGLNRFYVDRAEPELLLHFSRPVNVLDLFVPYTERILEQRLEVAEAARAMAEAERDRLQVELTEARTAIRNIFGSASWRLTKPVRALGSALGRLAP